MFDAEKGFHLAAVSVRKIPAMCLDPRIKSLNYLVNILARAEAQASGADEAIMLDIHGYVSEGAGDNLFLVRDGVLYTPEVQDALEGITRQTVIDMTQREGIPVHQTRLTLYDFYTADEVFATGSGAGIIAVTEVDKKAISGGRMGEMTRRIGQLYEQEVKKGEPVFDDA
jgi:branched-chain amino acid aminotransferase